MYDSPSDKLLIERGWRYETNVTGDWKCAWYKNQWSIFYDTGSQADLYIKGYSDKNIHVHGIIDDGEHNPNNEISLKKVLDKYGI